MTAPFHGAHARDYDRSNLFWSPVRSALDFAAELVLRDQPAQARMLCLGAGTGAEIAYFAERRPGWRFTAVDLSADMLDICRAKAEAGGFADRCAFHAGPVETLADDGPFDIATAILVSQFIIGDDARTDFFREIARRLRDGGDLLTVDLSAPLSGAARDAEIDRWLSAPAQAGAKINRADFDALVSVLPPERICDMVEGAGFTRPAGIFQFLLMRGWHARRERAR